MRWEVQWSVVCTICFVKLYCLCMDLATNQNLEKSEVYDEGNDEGRSHQDILNELYQNMRGWQSCLGPILVIVSVFLIYIIKYIYIYTYIYVHIYVTIPENMTTFLYI